MLDHLAATKRIDHGLAAARLNHKKKMIWRRKTKRFYPRCARGMDVENAQGNGKSAAVDDDRNYIGAVG